MHGLQLPKGLKTLFMLSPLLVLSALVLLLLNPVLFAGSESTMYLAITGDLLLTSPIVYFLCIRKTKIPNITVVPVFILGVVLGTILIPESHQNTLGLAKTWVLPLVELGVISLLAYKVIGLRKEFKKGASNTDFVDQLRMASNQIVPKQVVGALVTEASVFYYALFSWKKPVYGESEYTYHKNTAVNAMLYALLMAILIETIAIHFILAQWSQIAAWILSGLSIYTGLQVFALIKSIPRRPIVLDENRLVIRNGFMADCVIDIENIERLEVFRADLPEEYEKVKKLSLFEQNMVLHLRDEITIYGLYGITKKAKTLSFFADEPEQLLQNLMAKKH